MFNDKKGDMPTLEEIVKFIPHLALIIILVFIIVVFYKSCVAEQRDQADFDFDRIVSEIQDLGSEESIDVPIRGQVYILAVFLKGTSQSDFRCSKNTCICLYKSKEYNMDAEPSRCEKFDKAGKLESGNCAGGDFCIQPGIIKIETQNKINLNKKNKVVTISVKK